MQAPINAEADRQSNPMMPDPSSMCSDIGCEQMNQYMLAIIKLPANALLADTGAGVADIAATAGKMCLARAPTSTGQLAKAAFLGGYLFTTSYPASEFTYEPTLDVVEQFERAQDIAIEAGIEGEAQSLNPSYISPTSPPNP